MDINKLVQLGLTEKEARIYMGTLEIGRGSVVQISRKTGLPKSTTADTLKQLAKKQLVSVYAHKSRRRYAASDPRVLEERITRAQDVFQSVYPELEALYVEHGKKPDIRYYEGKEGLGVVQREILSEAKEIACVAAVGTLFSKMSEYFPTFSQQRAKKKIPIRIIARDEALARERKESGKHELRTIRIVESLPFQSLMYVWEDKVALMTLKEELMIVVIESRNITSMIRALFEIAWATGE